MTYTNLPAYQPQAGMRVLKGHRFAIAQRVPGQGAVVTAAFKTKREAQLARRRAMAHNEWVSLTLERRSDGWVPVAPQVRRLYAVPALVPA